MQESLEASFVRIRTVNGRVVGTSFLVGEGHLPSRYRFLRRGARAGVGAAFLPVPTLFLLGRFGRFPLVARQEVLCSHDLLRPGIEVQDANRERPSLKLHGQQQQTPAHDTTEPTRRKLSNRMGPLALDVADPFGELPQAEGWPDFPFTAPGRRATASGVLWPAEAGR